MKAMYIFVTVFIAATTTLVNPACAQTVGSTDVVGDEHGVISVTFDQPLSVETVMNTLPPGSYDMVSVQGSFTIHGRAIQDFVTIFPDTKVSDVQTKWQEGRKSMIAQLEKSGFFNQTMIPEEEKANSPDVFVAKSIRANGKRQAITHAVSQFRGEVGAFRSGVKGSSNGKEMRADQKAQPVQPIADGSGVKALAAVANTPYYLLVPSSGNVTTGTFTAPGVSGVWRGVLNYMYWNSNLFMNDQTYEHDFFLDAAGGTYFARSFTSPADGCFPQVVYAATSWPQSAYPFLDSDLEAPTLSVPYPHCSYTGNIAYSIGAGQANAITSGVNHFTAMLMPNGDTATDIFTLQGQVGYQNPVGCHDPLCSYPYGYAVRETTHYGFIYNGSVPSYRAWTYNGNVPDTPDQVSVTNPTSSSLRVNFRDITWDETNIVIERTKGVSGVWTVYNFGILNAGNAVGSWYWDNGGLEAHTSYCYRLRATNAKGNSAYSPVACGTTI